MHCLLISLFYITVVFAENKEEELHNACYQGDLDKATSLVKAGANIESRDYQLGITPLHTACFGSSVEVVKFLIDQGANLESRTLILDTPLMMAATAGRNDTVQELISKKANINAQNIIGATALINAAFTGHLDVVKTLVANGAKTDIRIRYERDEMDARRAAEYAGYLETAEYLKSIGHPGIISETSHSCENNHQYLTNIILSVFFAHLVTV